MPTRALGELLRPQSVAVVGPSASAVRMGLGPVLAASSNDDTGVDPQISARVRCAPWFAHLSRAAPAQPTMPENRVIKERRRAGRPPAGAKEGEKVTDYPQLSIRVPVEFKARLNALSAVTGLAQWRVIVEAINCFFLDLPATDRALVDGLSERLMRAG